MHSLLNLSILVICIRILAGCQGPAARLETVESYNLYQPIPIASGGRAQVYQLVAFFTAAN